MPKNIVVFSDGTGQDGGVRPEQRVSNVYKLYRAARVAPETAIGPSEQVAFYDPGLGTDIGATALTAPVRFVQKLLASVTGRGITRNIAECYEFIINHYRPGDRIFLIGFSRGAYTVRCVANLLMLCGVPTRSAAGPLPLFRKAVRDIADEAVIEVAEFSSSCPSSAFANHRPKGGGRTAAEPVPPATRFLFSRRVSVRAPIVALRAALSFDTSSNGLDDFPVGWRRGRHSERRPAGSGSGLF